MSSECRQQPRQPKGSPSGGRWASFLGAPADVSLTDNYLHGRARALTEGAYLQPIAVADADPRRLVAASQWWDVTSFFAEHNHAQGDYPAMPESGLYADGSRTRRWLYDDGEVAVRMASRSAIGAFASSLAPPKTFDMPIEADTPAGRVTMSVRVTHLGGDGWHVTCIGRNQDSEAKQAAAMAVRSILERQRVTRSVAELAEKIVEARTRQPAGTFRRVAVQSSFIKGFLVGAGAGDDEVDALVYLKNGKVYSYRAPVEVVEEVLSAPSPGSAYSRLLKGRHAAPPITARLCQACGRWARWDHSCEAHGARPRQRE